MSEIEYTVQIDAPVDRVWSFIEDFENWAGFMIGYQKMRIVDERRSVWTLRGDVGMLAREVDLQVDITEWVPGERVGFDITGLTEHITGSGSMVMSAVQPGEEAIEVTADTNEDKKSWGKRLQTRVARSVIDRVAKDSGVPDIDLVVDAETAPYTGEASRLTGRLHLKPGGAMAPMIDMLMAPMLQPAAEDFVRGIRSVLERKGSGAP